MTRFFRLVHRHYTKATGKYERVINEKHFEGLTATGQHKVPQPMPRLVPQAIPEVLERDLSIYEQFTDEAVAHLPFHKTLDQFDFRFQPSIEERRIRELATLRFLAHRENLIFLGPPGVGKTHLAVAIALEAIKQRHTVYFTTAHELVETLQQAHQNNTIRQKIKMFTKPNLLIIDEIGYRKMEDAAAHFFFQIVSERYETGSIILTSNKSYGAWGEIFGDSVLATAILDRLLHHSTTLESARVSKGVGNGCPRLLLF